VLGGGAHEGAEGKSGAGRAAKTPIVRSLQHPGWHGAKGRCDRVS
jgi:hypothetical protein